MDGSHGPKAPGKGVLGVDGCTGGPFVLGGTPGVRAGREGAVDTGGVDAAVDDTLRAAQMSEIECLAFFGIGG